MFRMPAGLNPNQLRLLVLCILSAAVVVIFGVSLYRSLKTYHVTVAAGNATGESYVFSSALKTVVENHYPRIRMTIRETGGTTENLRLLDQGQAEIAAAQADVQAGPSARLIANLYEDAFQLLVRDDSGIREFIDLRGKRVALARSGGQFQSFLSVAEHFGLKESDFRFVGEDDQSADRALIDGKADAAFRVRALGNSSIQQLVRSGHLHLVEVGQAAAMRIRWIAFEPSVIPTGAYLGNPPIPERDLATVAVKRTLVAHRDVPRFVVHAITETLVERRQELAQAIPEDFVLARPLLAHISPPAQDHGLAPALHAGAQEYYDKDKPSFLQENADFMALILTVALLMGSWIWELKRWVERSQKNRADYYIHGVVKLMNRAQHCGEPIALEELRHSLYDLLTEAVGALDQDQLSEESFQSFRGVWQIARDVIGERSRSIATEEGTAKSGHSPDSALFHDTSV